MNDQNDKNANLDDQVIDLSKARQKKEDKKKNYIPRSWNISYRNERWEKGNGNEKVGPLGGGNSGYVQQKEALFNLSKIPILTRFIVFSFIIVQILIGLVIPNDYVPEIMQVFAFIPAVFLGEVEGISFLRVFSPLTYGFLHGDWVHLIFNSIMMIAFGTMVERQLGAKVMGTFFIAGTCAGAAIFAVLHAHDIAHLIGASAGISALFGVVLHLMMVQIRRTQSQGKSMPFYGFVILWSAIMVVTGLMGQGVAWPSHLAGFLSGVIMFDIYKRYYIKQR